MTTTNAMIGQFDAQGRVIMPAYDQMPPFSSFLPGISGLEGIPLWVFYTNRGQSISGFGIESKDCPIMEFQPANKAYQQTDLLGFRTFIRTSNWLIEPFTSFPRQAVQRVMYIGMNELEIRETDQEHGLEIRVLYFNLPNEPLAGLVRQVSIHNIGLDCLEMEILDGIPVIYPFGVNNDQLKNMGRTIEAWMEVFHLESHLPFYRLRASAEDTSDIHSILAGNYALAESSGRLLPAVIDPRLIFGFDTSLRHPQGFLERNLEEILSHTQPQEDRTPCAFFGDWISLAPGETSTIRSCYGSASDFSPIEDLKTRLLKPGYFEQKYIEAQDLPHQLTNPIATRSANPLFDAYCRQTFLDNLLRGGWPLELAEKHIFHVFSRKHGDQERDYNYFFLAAEKYSQGNGSYRDINQNRRSDVLFEPRVREFNIRMFMSLIQTDGYNPLIVGGTNFTLEGQYWPYALNLVNNPRKLAATLTGPFTPGLLLEQAKAADLKVSSQEFIDIVLGYAQQHIQAEFKEGYWVDHWTYNLDQIESYLKLYPERKSELLFDSDPLPFFDSPAVVNPRSRKYVLANGHPRQLYAILMPEDKCSLIGTRQSHPNWVRSAQGHGEVFRLPLISKLILLAIVKFSSRDPLGMGLEMEAGRPGWDDALNGLPALFGSSLAESYELARLLDFLIGSLSKLDAPIHLPVEVTDLLRAILDLIQSDQTLFDIWDGTSTSREEYRRRTRLGVDGATFALPAKQMLSTLEQLRSEVQKGLERAQGLSKGLTPTYLAYRVVEYEVLEETDPEDRPYIKPTGFEVSPLPTFLEAPVHQLKILTTRQECLKLYQQVRQSQLFDPQLRTYKLNASLQDLPFSIGRARAFSPGWLENESIWLHMTLKYLLEILRAGLYQEFFEDLQHTIPLFLDPESYGRSPLENSSFIVSSAHPDPTLHGRGFVARMSGATAEFISIWFVLMTGGNPFTLDDQGGLQFSLLPKLPGWLFPENGILEYHFLGQVLIRIHNPSQRDTWGLPPAEYKLTGPEKSLSLSGPSLSEPYASSIREGHYSQIDVYY